MRVLPDELFLLYQQFVAEESLSVIRHDLRNKLGSIRNGAFYVRRKLEKIAPEIAIKDPRVPEFLAMIASELDAAEQIVQSRLPPMLDAEPVAASAILERVRARARIPATVQVIAEPSPGSRVTMPADEGALALSCLVENAVDAIHTNEAREGTVRLRVREESDHVAVEVDDDGPGFATGVLDRALEPYFTTRQGQLGIGLNIARRIATRWRGKLVITALPRGTRAALVLDVVR